MSNVCVEVLFCTYTEMYWLVMAKSMQKYLMLLFRNRVMDAIEVTHPGLPPKLLSEWSNAQEI